MASRLPLADEHPILSTLDRGSPYSPLEDFPAPDLRVFPYPVAGFPLLLHWI